MKLADPVAQHARQTPQKTALYFAGEDISYQALWQHIETATTTLQTTGVKPGDRVAWLGLNDPAMLVLLFALARLGAILLPLNYRLSLPELLVIIDHANATYLIAGSACPEPVLATFYSKSRLFSNDLMRLGPKGVAAKFDTIPVLSSSPVLLVYSSGTTGQPKGALHTQAGLLANCLASSDAHALDHEDQVLTVLPMFHVGGLCIQTLPALVAGATVTLHDRFDASAWLADVQQRRPTLSLLVPATMRAVLACSEFKSTDLSSLRQLSAGSSTIPGSLIEAFHGRGVPVCQVYGATETGPVSIYLKREDAVQQAGSAGKAGLNVAVKLVASTGSTVTPGAVGELCFHAPNVMAGYWQDDDNPAFQDGWFHTGDLAHCDANGFFWVVGRSKDMIISGGENIYPAELENILADCPQILEAAVVGMPDATWGEVAVAVVVKQPDSELDSGTVMKLFGGKLARFKHPHRVVFMDALPKTALGKVQKSSLLAHLR
jgi:fatty-acyl-CoA synthase